ncbi:hypothetical protein Rhe02_89260 [Rhizocola hellebori]|uniref:Zinc finger CGNR domain-containing protein n=1 Tax=Rhizocola hellebori TaxID=1392758 RepID=A0A8J3QGV1_9ACTN|nr:ABATE domain-containing protein [Rhizocola hellebori]GIH10859.1 hypothetical protein Rhe02_89260 [Rhizocola hellebori]
MARSISTLELAGNVLCLDFANTVNSRLHPVHDYLSSYDDLLDWFGHASSIPPQTIDHLRPLAGTAPADDAVAQAHRLREAIYGVFSAMTQDGAMPEGALDVLTAAFRSSMAHAVITGRQPKTYDLTWAMPAPPDPAFPLWAVSQSAGELLLSEQLERVGECPGCGWLFLDTSRNGGRRWCSMATCGSRDKMARYHRQQRKAGDG